MRLDPIFKILRAVKKAPNGEVPTCPKCKAANLLVVEKTDEKRSGVICRSCGWWHGDAKTDRHFLRCEDTCGEEMGPVSILEGMTRPKYICRGCAERRKADKVEPDPSIKVRTAIRCQGECGTLVGYIDHPEGTNFARKRMRLGFCDPCRAKLPKTVVKNMNPSDVAMKEIVDYLKGKKSAPVTAEELALVVEKLNKLK